VKTFTFVTDSASICVFDLARLQHRLADDADWWSVPEQELEELNKGNVVFASLGRDGRCEVRFVDELSVAPAVQCRLAVTGGRVFVGAGEEVTSDGLEPECVRGGTFLHVPPGVYLVNMARPGLDKIDVSFSRVEGTPENYFTRTLSL
jgi:hypothetical protein